LSENINDVNVNEITLLLASNRLRYVEIYNYSQLLACSPVRELLPWPALPKAINLENGKEYFHEDDGLGGEV